MAIVCSQSSGRFTAGNFGGRTKIFVWITVKDKITNERMEMKIQLKLDQQQIVKPTRLIFKLMNMNI